MGYVNISSKHGAGVVPGQAQNIGESYAADKSVVVQANGDEAVSNALYAILMANDHMIEPKQWFRVAMVPKDNPEGRRFVTVQMRLSDIDPAIKPGDTPLHQLTASLESLTHVRDEISRLILGGADLATLKICPSTPKEQNTVIKAVSYASKVTLGRAGHDLSVVLQYKREPIDQADKPPIELIVIPVKHRS